jgi:hypothetical protein
MSLRLLFLVFFAAFVVGCAPTVPVVTRKSPVSTPTASSNQSYDEDLSAVRPRYKEMSVVDNSTKKIESKPTTLSQPLQLVNKQVDAILDTISIQNRALRFAVGYRIQIYAGNLRTEADDAKLFVYQNYPELLPYITFISPTYRVKVGDFMNKLDAECYLQQVRQQFASAIILPEKIDLKKSLLVK